MFIGSLVVVVVFVILINGLSTIEFISDSALRLTRFVVNNFRRPYSGICKIMSQPVTCTQCASTGTAAVSYERLKLSREGKLSTLATGFPLVLGYPRPERKTFTVHYCRQAIERRAIIKRNQPVLEINHAVRSVLGVTKQWEKQADIKFQFPIMTTVKRAYKVSWKSEKTVANWESLLNA